MKIISLLIGLCVVGSSIGLSASTKKGLLSARPSPPAALPGPQSLRASVVGGCAALPAHRTSSSDVGGRAGERPGSAGGFAEARNVTLPLEAQFAVSAALGRDQTAYHFIPRFAGVAPMSQADPASPKGLRRAGEIEARAGYQAANPNQHFNVRFDAQGACVVSDGMQWDLSLQAWGYDDALPAELSAEGGSAYGRENLRHGRTAAPFVSANRVEYHRGTLTEWYVNGPLGLQQGFTVNAPPTRNNGPGHAPLTLVLNLPAARLSSPKSGGGQTKVDADRKGLTLLTDKNEPVLRYSGLTALDADGVRLPAWLETQNHDHAQRVVKLLLRVDDSGARYPITIDPFIQQAKLTAADGAANDNFGSSVALSSDGNTAIVNASADVGGNTNQGAAYVFTRSASAWIQQAKLTASDGAANDYFGSSVALSSDGNTAIASANRADVAGNSDQGAAYVFTRSGTNWIQQVKLIASDGAASDFLGRSVALSSDGDTAIAGAYFADVGGNFNQGAAYVFTRSGSAWNLQEKLTASDGAPSDSFGISVALSSDGNTAFAGMYLANVGTNSDQGAAYVFTRSGTNWAQQAKLIATDGAASDVFGYAVALSSDGNTAFAGAWTADVGTNSNQGAAYIFTRSGTNWNQQAKLTATGGASNNNFGSSVALSGDGNTAFAGAASADVGGNAGQGAAYVFMRTGAFWVQQVKLIASDGAVNDYFGLSVALSGDGNTAIAGAYADVGGNVDQGAAYVFAFGTLQFAASAYSVSESSGSVTVTVTRANGTSGAASVLFQTTNGTATAGTDYTATNGTLTWPDGNADNQAVTVPIINRYGAQGSRSFSIALSGAFGVALGSPTSTTVTIINTVLTPPTNVVASYNFYIDRVRVTWDATAAATGYEVWRGASNATNLATRIGTDISGTNYDDLVATAGTPYYYWVKTTNASGASAFSTSAIGQVLFGPDVRLNGAAGPVTVAVGVVLVVTVSMNPAQYAGYPVDWWVAASTPVGLYYLNGGMAWTTASAPVYQGDLFGLQSAVALDTTELPTGTYTFYFGVDTLNGILDPEVVYDSATATVVP